MFALERLDEPSGARPAAGPSTAAAGVPAADQQEDDDTAGDTDLPPEEYDSEDFYSDAVDYYMWKRDVIAEGDADPYFKNMAVIEYVNLKFIENNFRTIGLNKIFDKNCIMKAQIEFKSFEEWFIRKQQSVVGKKYVNICLPLFCHLYLDLYSQNDHERMLKLLDVFKHLFVSPKGIIFLEELKDFTGNDNLSPRLSLFRKNKFVFTTTPVFLSSLCNFFQDRSMLKSVFQEWFDVNFNTDEDAIVILNKYCFKTLSNIYDLEQNDDELMQNVTNDDLSKEVSNNEGKEKKHSRKCKSKDKPEFTGSDKCCSSESSSEDSSGDSSSETSFSDDELVNRKFMKNKNKSSEGLPFKSSCHFKTSYTTKIDLKTLDEDSHLRTTRQITLTNCSKLSCTILTSDHKFVAAGSLDSLIYLWERSNVSTELERNSILNNIECEVGKSDKPLDQSNNFIEHLDRSTAKILRGHGGSIFDLAELPTPKILISASCDKTFRVWDLVSKCCLEVYNEHEHRTWCVTACPYTLQVVTGSCDGNGCLWFLNYKRPLRVFSGHLDDVLVVKFHPNQVVIATGSADKTVRVFELVTGVCLRIFVGHKDYVTCLEFHDEKPNILASASGAGEIILWDLPTGNILWRIKVENVLFSDLAWLTNDVILASLTTGVILKCDTTENYMKTARKVKGFTTKLNRLLSLKIIDTLVYTVGIPAKFTPMEHQEDVAKTAENESHGQQKPRSSRALSPFKLFSSQFIIENDSVKSKLDLKSKDLQKELTIDPSDTTLLTPEFFEMDLQNLPFDITSDEAAKLNSQYQTDNIKLTKNLPTKMKTNLKSSPRTSARRSGQMSNFSSTSTNAPQITNKQQSDINQPNLLPQNHGVTNVQKINTDIQKTLQLHTNGETNLPNTVLIKQQPLLQKDEGNSSTGIGQQQPKTRPLARARTRNTKKSNQKSVLQEEQQLPQNYVGGNFISSPTTLQQPLYQQIGPNTQPTKLSVQQQNPTHIRLANRNISQTKKSSFSTQNISTASMPIRLTVGQKILTVETQSPRNDYRRLSPTSVDSLLCTNPGIVSSDQPVFSEVTKSESSDNTKSKSQTDSKKKKNNKK